MPVIVSEISDSASGVGWIKWTPKSGKIERRRCQIERYSTRKAHPGIPPGSGQIGSRREDICREAAQKLSLAPSTLAYWVKAYKAGKLGEIGKMVVGIRVVGAQGNTVGFGDAAIREILGKTLSTIALCIGFFWIAGDTQKQGWHDKIASTYVVKVVKAQSTG